MIDWEMERASVMVGGLFAGIIPFACGVLGAVLANMPVSFTSGLLPPPLLALMPVYFWSLVRPDLMPPWAAFVLGLLQDLLSGMPPGVWAASFIAAYALVDRQRDSFAGLSGWAAVLGFGIVAFVASLCAFVLVAFYFRTLPPVTPALGLLIVTVVLYAPVAVILAFFHRRLVGSARTHL
ncbi:MAG TPA: rod shape-determining protein MreD [Rhizomicrobium sp.]|nr:rod shape-determining protein MreD [Rhizomicrobium sp.]